MRLKDRVAIITGASTGLGLSMAEVFSEEGASVVINYPDESEEENATNLAAKIKESGGRAITVQADVSDWEQVGLLTDETLQTFGTIDILINNAGVNSYKTIEEIDLDIWNKTIAVTLTGTFICTRHVLPLSLIHI